MINPYMPNMIRIDNAYRVLKEDQEKYESKKMSLAHPYKTVEDVLAALKINGLRTNDVFSKMSQDLRKDTEAMLQLIKKDALAYLYVNPNINTLEFKQRALTQNPSIYGMLSNQDRQNRAISQSYLDGMINMMSRRQIDASEHAYQFSQQFSNRTNFEQVFSDEVYDKSFRRLALNGPYENNALSKDFTITATARLLRPEMKRRYDEIERNVWLQNPQKVHELAYNDRGTLSVNYALEAIEERCPEYKPSINQKQKEYWNDRKNELLELQDRQNEGDKLNGVEIRLLQEAKKHIELKKEKKMVEQRVQRAREEEIVYFKRDAIERAYAAAADGDISFDRATDIAAYVGNAPNTTDSGRATEHIAACTAKVNDIDNIDEERVVELEELDEYYDELEQESENSEYVIEAPDSERIEDPEYLPWNYSPPDEERVPEYKPY